MFLRDFLLATGTAAFIIGSGIDLFVRFECEVLNTTSFRGFESKLGLIELFYGRCYWYKRRFFWFP